MSEARLEIVLEALNMASDELKAVQRDLGELDNVGKKNTGTFEKMQAGWRQGALVLGSITAAAYTAKKAFDFVEEGAEIELVNDRLDRLAEGIGTTASALERDLKTATRGMMTDFEQASLATDLLSLGLAKNHKEAVRLTRVASALNMDMNQLVLTLTNQTTMRFDALGVAVDGFEEKVNKLEQAGHDANEAFQLAFLEQAEDQIERVGDVADTTSGRIQRLEVRFLNLVDTAKTTAAESNLLSDALGEVEEAFSIHDAVGLLDGQVISLRAGFFKLYEGVRLNTGEFVSYEEALALAEEKQGEMNFALQEASEMEEAYLRSIGQWEDATMDYAAAAEDAAGATADWLDITGNLDSELERAIESANLAAIGYGELEQRGWDIVNSFDPATDSQSRFEQSLLGTRTAAILAHTAIGQIDAEEATEQLQGLGYSAGEAAYFLELLDGEHNIKVVLDWISRGFDIEKMLNTEQVTIGQINRRIGSGGEQFRAAGGPVSAGALYQINEPGWGPEMFIPNQDGQIVNQPEMARMGGMSAAEIRGLREEMRTVGRKLDALPRALARAVQANYAKSTGLRS